MKLLFDTHQKSAPEAVEIIRCLEPTPDQLRAMHAHERRHPKRARTSVLNAIEERLGELKVDEPARGLARAPMPDSAPTFQHVSFGDEGMDVTFERADEQPEPPAGPVTYVDHNGQKHLATVLEPKVVAVLRLRDPQGTRVIAEYDRSGRRGTWR